LIYSNISAQILIDSTRVIFEKHIATTVDLNNDSIISRFTPTVEEILFADSIIHQHVSQKHSHVLPYFSKNIYYKQYVGILTVNGKIIYVNAQCNEIPEQFLTNTTAYARGGGSCFYRSLVLLNNGEIQQFRFNAPR
jgi:hypothetical protein